MLVRRCYRGRLALAAVALSACVEAGDETAMCVGNAEQPLVNGAVTESYLGLGPAQIRSIVAIVGEKPSEALCTGAFVSRDWVVTAGHCAQMPSPTIVMASNAGGSTTVVSVLRSIVHPQQDIALLNVNVPDTERAGLASLLAGDPTAGRLEPGVPVELAGYGVTEGGTFGDLRFLVEPVVGVEPRIATVSGFGASGACAGDSGSPLLIRGASGAVVIMGVLSGGSASCVNEDTYVRVDVLSDWLRSYVAPDGATVQDCGTIDERGRCLYGNAIHCARSELRAEACSGSTTCGWDETAKGFRCVEAGSDPCDGVDFIGTCRSEAAVRCNNGALERVTCTPCQTCRFDGKTGTAACAEQARASDPPVP